MNRCFFGALFLLSRLPGSTAFGRAPGQPQDTRQSAVVAYGVASFDAELHRIVRIIEKNPSSKEMASLRDSLPQRWTVSTSELTYSFSTEPLRNQLTAGSAANALTWVKLLSLEVESYSTAPDATSHQARAELDRILARPEFASVRPPGAW